MPTRHLTTVVSPIISGAAWVSGFSSLMLHEMRRQGWTDEQIFAIVAESKPENQPVQEIVAGLKGRFASQVYAADLIPPHCKVLDDVKPRQFQMSDLEFIPFIEDEQRYISGEMMRKSAEDHGANFGLVDGKFIREHFNEIPESSRSAFSMVLTGTLLFDSTDNRLKVGHMFWNGAQLVLNFPALIFGWYRHHRLPHIKIM